MTDVADQTPHFGQQHIDVDNDSIGSDDRSVDQKKQDAELAERLSSIIEGTNERVTPLCKMIRKVGVSDHTRINL